MESTICDFHSAIGNLGIFTAQFAIYRSAISENHRTQMALTGHRSKVRRGYSDGGVIPIVGCLCYQTKFGNSSVVPQGRLILNLPSGGSRNFERGVQQVGWHVHSAPPKALRRAAKRRSVRAKRGKIFLRVLFSDQEALS